MSVIDFDHLNVTTMTVIVPFSGEVELDLVFPLLEITRIDLPPTKRQTQKFKIPHCAKPGAILSARYKGTTRGIVKSQSTRYFLNAITLDISTIEKNVSIKLSKSKMHICGSTSTEQSREASQHVLNQLTYIQNMLNYINEDEERTKTTVEWLFSATRGSIKLTQTTYHENSQDQPRFMITHELKQPDIDNIPTNVDTKIVKFLINQMNYFIYYEDFCMQVNWITQLKTIVTADLKIIDILKVMVNFNYDLGFDINRWALANHINGVNGFTARYENTFDHSVTIELPYEIPEGMKVSRRKDRVPCHTFLVYKSGLVTQSGPNEELMRSAYNLFNSTINSIRHLIVKPGGTRKLKYYASNSTKVKAIIEKSPDSCFTDSTESNE